MCRFIAFTFARRHLIRAYFEANFIAYIQWRLCNFNSLLCDLVEIASLYTSDFSLFNLSSAARLDRD